MSFPNSSWSDIITTTLQARSGRIQDNVTKNNAILMRLKQRGKMRPVDGGQTIVEEVSFAENGNGGWYSGYDTLPIGPQDVISAFEFNWKQYAVPVVMNGLEKIQNAGKAKMLDLADKRMDVAESTMANAISQGMYSDGTASGGKQIGGLDLLVPQDPTTGTIGGINRANYTFARSQLQDPASTPTSTTIQGVMNTLWASCSRGSDRPDLVLAGSTIWATYLASLQALQRFTDVKVGDLGFETIKFMTADLVLDGGVGGFATATDMYFLNTKYVHYRPSSVRNMVPLDPSERYAVNQDASVAILGWAGNMTISGPQFCGRLKGD